jgi:hypothetical protein
MQIRAFFQRFSASQKISSLTSSCFKQVVVGEHFESLACFAFVEVSGMKAFDELIQIRAFQSSLKVFSVE